MLFNLFPKTMVKWFPEVPLYNMQKESERSGTVTKVAFLWPKNTLALQDWKYTCALLGSWMSPIPDPAGLCNIKMHKLEL